MANSGKSRPAIAPIAAMLLLLLVVATPSAAGTPAVHAARIARFDGFLAETMALYRRAGAVPMKPLARFGYPYADLIDPAVVTDETKHVLERYATYRTMLKARRPSDGAAAPPAARPAGSSTPEDHVRGVDDGTTDATAAIEQALAAGDLWLTPGRHYLITHTIAVPSNRRIASDGTGTIVVAVGGTGFPDAAFDPGGYRDVLQVHAATQVGLTDFRLQTPIADPSAPQPLLHGIDIQASSNVLVAGVELRGFARTKGIVRINSSSDVTIEDNLIHGSYTRRLTRQVTGIEVDENRVRLVAGQPQADSRRVLITGNFIFGLLLDPAVYLDTTLRQGPALNDETTAITLMRMGPAPTIRVDDNIMVDIGQGLDIATSGGRFSGNIIERASEYALKIGHTASDNSFDGFTITASGMGAVVIYSLPGEPVSGNSITNTRIRYPGTVIGLPGLRHYGIILTSKSGEGPSTNGGNNFTDVHISDPPPADALQASVACVWKGGNVDAAPNRFEIGIDGAVLRSGVGC